jgi:hypothetical protein
MKVQEVVLRAIAKKIAWWQAAEILRRSGRRLRRLRQRYEEHGYDGLMDRRRGKPSTRRVALATVLGLYRAVSGGELDHLRTAVCEGRHRRPLRQSPRRCDQRKGNQGSLDPLRTHSERCPFDWRKNALESGPVLHTDCVATPTPTDQEEQRKT